MGILRRLVACGLLGSLGLPVAASLYDFGAQADLPKKRLTKETVSFPIYEDRDLGVYLRRMKPGKRHKFARVAGDTVVVSLHPQKYRSNKVVSTPVPGQKDQLLERGDFFYRVRGQTGGGWYVGEEGTFDVLIVRYPPIAPDVLWLDEGRIRASDDSKKGLFRIAVARAALDAGGAPSTVTMVESESVRVDAVRISTAVSFRNGSPAGEVAILLDGSARVVAEGRTEPLTLKNVVVTKPGEPLTLEAEGGVPATVLRITLLKISWDRSEARTPPSWDWDAPRRSTAAPHPPPPIVADPARAAIDWVRFPGGRFEMGTGIGDEGPVHSVTLQSFELSRTHVTFKQYRACVAAGACTQIRKDCVSPEFTTDEHPVVCVDWQQARTFAQWAGGRLPSEAEFEFAARSGGKNKKFPWGNDPPSCERTILNHGDGTGCGRPGPWPVCSRPAGNTEQGLCDMAGNVWQWMEDWYHRLYKGAPSDGRAWVDPPSVQRVQRGSSWIANAIYARTTARSGDDPALFGNYIGIRVARTPL